MLSDRVRDHLIEIRHELLADLQTRTDDVVIQTLAHVDASLRVHATEGQRRMGGHHPINILFSDDDITEVAPVAAQAGSAAKPAGPTIEELQQQIERERADSSKIIDGLRNQLKQKGGA